VAQGLFEELGDRRGVAWTLHGRAVMDRCQGTYLEAQRRLEESLELFRALDATRGLAWADYDLAAVHFAQGDPARASALYEEALAVFIKLDDQPGIGWVHHDRGIMARREGNRTARAHCSGNPWRYFNALETGVVSRGRSKTWVLQR
jgi:tetratricopeptide (TPR) repeat protein